MKTYRLIAAFAALLAVSNAGAAPVGQLEAIISDPGPVYQSMLFWLDASQSTAPVDDPIVSYEWTYDGYDYYALGPQILDGTCDVGTYTMGLRVITASGATAATTIDVDIQNLAPVISNVPDTQVTPAWGQLSLMVYAEEVCGEQMVLSTVDFGDGVIVQSPSLGDGWGWAAFELNHYYDQSGAYTVAIEVCDSHGGCATKGIEVTADVTEPIPLPWPTAIDLNVTTFMDQPVSFKLQATPSFNCATVTEGPQYGTVDRAIDAEFCSGEALHWIALFPPDGLEVTYTPQPGFVGQDELRWKPTNRGEGSISGPIAPVRITVVSRAPTANAGVDQTRNEGSAVVLAGTGSDPEGDPLTFLWSQVSGPPVVLAAADTAIASFDAPMVSADTPLVFRLTVTDPSGNSAFDEVTVTVQHAGSPPNCALAQAVPSTLWPPNHQLVSINVVGAADPVGNPVAIGIIAVTQDEPTSAVGSGDRAPDAVHHASGDVLLRAERKGSGNGRVYRVTFDAASPTGSCTGTVTVTVPHDKQSTAIDDGQIYDSLLP